MARMNISIPDPLYERLDRLRDRVNASKVCAQALERELNMLENRNATLVDPEIGQLIQRLQGVRDRWYQRGRDDAKRWAVQHATRDELWRLLDTFEGESGGEIADAVLHRKHGQKRWFPQSANPKENIADWIRRDQQTGERQVSARRADDDDRNEGGNWFEANTQREQDDEEAPTAYGTTGNVDEASYMEGWRDMVDDIWKAVSAAFKR